MQCIMFMDRPQIEGGQTTICKLCYFFFFFLSRRHLEGSKYQGVRGFLAWQEPVGQLFSLSIKSRLKLSLSVQIGASKEGLIDMGGGECVGSNSTEK